VATRALPVVARRTEILAQVRRMATPVEELRTRAVTSAVDTPTRVVGTRTPVVAVAILTLAAVGIRTPVVADILAVRRAVAILTRAAVTPIRAVVGTNPRVTANG
jgi:hypothetical protein